jgi:hypothetical protein
MNDSAAAARFGATDRRDAWWVGPAAVFLGLGAFIVYSTWAAFQGDHYTFGPYLSPFYSPVLWGDPAHAWFGAGPPSWWPAWMPKFSPAFLILWAPGGFRLTCYYYRKAYYRAFWADPPACAVAEPRHDYRGETRLLLFQNLHRYFFYVAVAFIGILWFDAIRSYRFDGKFGIGVGSLVLTLNAFLLMMYTFSCHSCRHLVGGCLDCVRLAACGPLRYRVWKSVTRINEHHMFWAWVSLTGVGLADLYVRLCSMGLLTDWRIV